MARSRRAWRAGRATAGRPASAGSGDPTVGTFGRWQGDGSSTDVQAVQTVPVVEGLTYTVSVQLAGTGVAAHPGVLQADARNAGGGAVAFNVVSFAQVGDRLAGVQRDLRRPGRLRESRI